MSGYVVPTWNPAWAAKVGWHAPAASYWFVVYTRNEFGGVDVPVDELAEVHLSGGLDDQDPIRTVAELVAESWGEINWETESGFDAVTVLRDDPSYEYLEDPDIYRQRGVTEFLCDALDNRRVVAWERSRGHKWMWPDVNRVKPAIMPRPLKKAD